MGKILLVEDDDVMRPFLAKALQRGGLDVVAAADGEAGLELFAAEPEAFDLVLTDIVMPGLDGIELARRIVEMSSSVRIMFITGFAAVALTASKHDGPAKVLGRPFHLRDLVEQIRTALAQPTPPRPVASA